MKALQIIPVLRQSTSETTDRPEPLTLEEIAGKVGTWELSRRPDGTLQAVEQAPAKGTASGGDAAAARRLGFLRLTTERGKAAWFLVPASPDLAVNGMAPPLSLVRLQPGALLSLADEFLTVAHLWSAEPGEAPPELAEKECPVCGLELKAAPVVACLCGNFMHLERPDQPDDVEALNCYLTNGTCGSCQRKTSLEPQTVPEIPAALLADSFDDDWSLE